MESMTKVILICGKICCGKSTYAKHLCESHKAVLLSVDEIMLELFGFYAGDKHDEYAEKVQSYLLNKSVEFIRSGVNVVLDWGFWLQSKRIEAREFYRARDIDYEFHYLDVSDGRWKQRIMCRNELIEKGATEAYIIDDNLLKKFEGLFEVPSRDEIDVWFCGG